MYKKLRSLGVDDSQPEVTPDTRPLRRNKAVTLMRVVIQVFESVDSAMTIAVRLG
jgi:hypothetical protein